MAGKTKASTKIRKPRSTKTVSVAQKSKAFAHAEDYRLLVEQMSDGLFIADSNGYYIDVNPAGCRLLGYTREEILGKHMRDLTKPDGQPLRLEELRAGKIIMSEREMICKDGSLISVEISAKQLPDGRFQGIVRDISERKRTQAFARQALAYAANVIETANVMFVQLDLQGRVVKLNQAATQVTGFALAEVEGKNWFETLVPRDRYPHVWEEFSRLTEKGELPRTFENPVLTRTGEERYIFWQNSVLREETKIVGTISFGIDMTERKHADKRILRLSHLYATLSQVNQAIVRTKSSTELYQAICQIAIEFGQFSLAWIGLLDRATGDVCPVAHAGINGDYLDALHINLRDEQTGRGPTGTAIRTGKTVANDDMQANPAMSPWRAAARKRNYRSSVSIPFRLQGETIGALNLYHTEPGFFGEAEELHLLEEISLDISFALDAMAAEQSRQHTEQALRESEENYRQLFEAESDAILLIENATGQILQANNAACAMYGFSRDELLTKKNTDLSAEPAETQNVTQNTPLAFEQVVVIPLRYHRRRDGTIFPVEITGRFFTYKGCAVHIAAIRDITERKRTEEKLKHSYDLMRYIIENTKSAVAVHDRDLRYIYVSQSYLDQYNVQPRDIIGKQHYEVFPDLPQKWRDVHQRALQGEVCSGDRDPYYRANGTVEWTRWECRPWFQMDGSIGGIIVYTEVITDRVQAEVELRESEERYRSLFRNNHAVMLVVDPATGAIQDANPAAAEYYGWMEEELRQKNISEINLLTPEQVKQAMARVQAKTDYHFFFKHRLKDGSIRDVEVFSGLVILQGRQLLYSIVHDITEQKRAQEALRQAEEKYRTLVEEIPIVVYEADADGHTLYISPQVEKFCGFTAQEWLTDPTLWLQQIDPSDKERVFAENARAMAANQSYANDYRLTTKTGETIWIHDEGRWVYDSPRAKPILRGIWQNITERVRAEEALEKSEDEYRQLFQNNPNPMWAFDPTTLKFLAVNDAAVMHYGYTREEFLAMTIKDIRPPEEFQVLEDDLAHLSDSIGSPKLWRHRKKDGTLIDVEVTGHWTMFGGIRARIVLANDVTERKRAEDQIQHQLDRMSALRAIDAAISTSFDLRLTLEVVIGKVISELRVDAAAVMLLNSPLHTLEYYIGKGFRTNITQRPPVRVGEGNAGRVALERRMLHIANLREIPGLPRGEDFVAYYGVPLIAKGQVKGVLEIYHRSPFNGNAEWLDFLETLAGQAAIAVDNTQLFDDLQRSNFELELAYDATIEGWSRALDLRDRETEGHTLRVVDLTLELARAVGVNDGEIVHLRRGALLHDIGKMGVPDAILLKPDKLTPDEWDIMRRHPVYAREMLLPIAYLRPALDIPYCHHEKWDGSGYPRGLKSAEIPLAARIFALVDVWDALSHDRPYRAAWHAVRVEEHIKAEAGKHFDPHLVDVFMKLVK